MHRVNVRKRIQIGDGLLELTREDQKIEIHAEIAIVVLGGGLGEMLGSNLSHAGLQIREIVHLASKLDSPVSLAGEVELQPNPVVDV